MDEQKSVKYVSVSQINQIRAANEPRLALFTL